MKKLLAALVLTSCAGTQAKQVQDASVLALGQRETVCLLIDQAAASSSDKTIVKAQELCNAGAELQAIIDSLATPCEGPLDSRK